VRKRARRGRSRHCQAASNSLSRFARSEQGRTGGCRLRPTGGRGARDGLLACAAPNAEEKERIVARLAARLLSFRADRLQIGAFHCWCQCGGGGMCSWDGGVPLPWLECPSTVACAAPGMTGPLRAGRGGSAACVAAVAEAAAAASAVACLVV
jgi:hypothetical protein